MITNGAAERVHAADPDPYARLFTGPRGVRVSTAVRRDATHRDEVVTSLGLEYLRRHDLRHNGLTWFADVGVPAHALRKIAGHGYLLTTQRPAPPRPAPPRPGDRDRPGRRAGGP